MSDLSFYEAACEFIRLARLATHQECVSAHHEGKNRYETWRVDGELLMGTHPPAMLEWGFKVFGPPESRGVTVFGQAAEAARDSADVNASLFAQCVVRKVVVLTPTLTELWAALDATTSNDWGIVSQVIGIDAYDAEVAKAAGWYDLRLSETECLELRAAARTAPADYALDLLNAGVPVSEVIEHCKTPNPMPAEYAIAMAGAA